MLNLNIDVDEEVCSNGYCDGSHSVISSSYATDMKIQMWVNGTNQSPNRGEGTCVVLVVAA